MASSGIMSRLNAVVSGYDHMEYPNTMTRFLGGHTRENHPYISGYWYFIIQPPDKVYTNASAALAQKWFLSTCEGFTPPSRNMNKVDVPGLGGVQASFVSGQTLNRTFTTTFREYKNLIMLKLINIWSGIITPYDGVSELSGKDWMANAYKGFAAAILTKPVNGGVNTLTADNIEEVFLFDGVWPESSPYDALNQDISANDSIVLSVAWNFDGWCLTSADNGVVDKAVAMINNLSPTYNYDRMLKDVTSSSASSLLSI
jgi:hypothetical protein